MNGEISLLELHDSVHQLSADLKSHMLIEELTSKNQFKMTSDTRDDIKNYKVHLDSVIKAMKEHFDNKITDCNSRVILLLQKEHYNRIQIDTILQDHATLRRDDITKAISASEKRSINKVRWFAGGVVAFGMGVAFISKYGHIIMAIINSGAE